MFKKVYVFIILFAFSFCSRLARHFQKMLQSFKYAYGSGIPELCCVIELQFFGNLGFYVENLVNRATSSQH